MKTPIAFTWFMSNILWCLPASASELGGLTVAYVDLSAAKHPSVGRSYLAAAAALTLKEDSVRGLNELTRQKKKKLPPEKYHELAATEAESVKAKEVAFKQLRMQQTESLQADLAKTCADFDIVVEKGAQLYPAVWSDTGKAVNVTQFLRNAIPYKGTNLARRKVGYVKGLVLEKSVFESCSDTPSVIAEDPTHSIVNSIHRLEAESSILCALAKGKRPCYAESKLNKIAEVAQSKGLDLVVDDTQVLTGIDALHVGAQDITNDVLDPIVRN